RFSSNVANSRFRAFRLSIFYARKVPMSMHSVRLGTHEIDLDRHAAHLPSHQGRCTHVIFMQTGMLIHNHPFANHNVNFKKNLKYINQSKLLMPTRYQTERLLVRGTFDAVDHYTLLVRLKMIGVARTPFNQKSFQHKNQIKEKWTIHAVLCNL
ncbi:MAG: hypothetical protein ABJ056_02885, partial [Halioglobus sp.]